MGCHCCALGTVDLLLHHTDAFVPAFVKRNAIGGAPVYAGDDSMTGEEMRLQYELYVPTGWERARRHKGIVALHKRPDAFATIAVSMVAQAVGKVATPTLVVLMPDVAPVRGGTAYIDVTEQ